MPIIKSTGKSASLWDQLKADGVTGDIETLLPDVGGLRGQAAADAVSDYTWGRSSLAMQQDFGRHTVTTAARTVGFPEGKIFNGAKSLMTRLDPAQDLMDNVEGLLGAGYATKLNGQGLDAFGSGIGATGAGAALGDAMEGVFGEAFDAIGHVTGLARDLVPVIGGVIHAIVTMARLFGGKREEPPAPVFSLQRSEFNPLYDQGFANLYVLERMRATRDWTPLWSPPGLANRENQVASRWGATRVDYPGGQEFGWKIYPADIHERVGGDGWTGCVPLTGDIDHGWEVSRNGTWQSGTRSLGVMLPTAKSQLPELWATISKPNTGANFTVDPAKLADRWLTYLYRFRTRIEEGFAPVPPDAMRAFIDESGVEYYGWKKDNPSFNYKDVPEQYRIREWGLEKTGDPKKSNLFDALDALAKTQRASVDTVACAYADETFVAVKPGQPLHSRWYDNRMALLQHSAVCRVDLESVPDTAYRNQVKSAQDARGCKFGQLNKLSAGPLVSNTPDAPPPAQGLNGTIKAVYAGGSGGGSNKGAILIAAAVLGFMAMKNKRR